eukprot:CAMPEP_0181318652 /NCGR_PEP_ID=MMETSP1101-20121128/17123_1 /TAXON_ID=46948 /ORGANISM="Rhodomonas abbreviata, Strain Caron Lab Isolate" /LENGTH=287 /DNA_ID=CAMNT_0023426141 /DNA_START=99 /DNA_END=962 /DNA_ORIENTATION=+
MSEFNSETDWKPPAKVETLYAATAGNKFADMNRPTAGARDERELPVGTAPVQLYSLATPNGHKVGILFEELELDYDAHFISFSKRDQFSKGFVDINPNSKIPAVVDRDGPGGEPLNLFESGSIMQYFAEKHGKFLPTDPRKRAECFNWIHWQMAGLGPMCGNFGHFFVYAPADKKETRDYGAARYGMEVQRLCSVLDQHLATTNAFMVGDEYTIADMVIFPWYHQLTVGYTHASGVNAAAFLSTDQYTHANAWADRLRARPQVMRGMKVTSGGVGKPWLEAKEEDKA